jgi:hypothetical protein
MAKRLGSSTINRLVDEKFQADDSWQTDVLIREAFFEPDFPLTWKEFKALPKAVQGWCLAGLNYLHSGAVGKYKDEKGHRILYSIPLAKGIGSKGGFYKNIDLATEKELEKVAEKFGNALIFFGKKEEPLSKMYKELKEAKEQGLPVSNLRELRKLRIA